MTIEGTVPVTGNGRVELQGPGGELSEAQRLLRVVYPGSQVTESGRLDPATTQALRDFQSLRGLPETGRLDAATLGELRRWADWTRHESAEAVSPTPHPPPPTTPARTPRPTDGELLARQLGDRVPVQDPRPQQRAGETSRSAEPGGMPEDARQVPGFRTRPMTGVERLAWNLVESETTIRTLRQLAERTGCTIVVGVGGSIGGGERGSAGIGVYIGPRGEIGITGSATIGEGVVAGGSLGVQFTMVRGGPEALRGPFMVAGAGAAGGVGVGGEAIFDMNGDLVGGTGSIGPGGEFEIYGGMGWGFASEPLNRAR